MKCILAFREFNNIQRKLFIRVMKPNLMRSLFLVYFVSQHLHVSGKFVAHHQCIKLVFIAQIYRDTR
jgi:hypothetical protein